MPLALTILTVRLPEWLSGLSLVAAFSHGFLMSSDDEAPRVVTFIGGLYQHWTFPLIALNANPERLCFSLRFGLGRWFGPWVLRHSEITEVTSDGTVVGVSSGVYMQRGKYDAWVFKTPHPVMVLLELERLGYPVRNATNGRDA